MERMEAAQSERDSRIKDSKHTHIVLGFHSTPRLSEKVSDKLYHAFSMLNTVNIQLWCMYMYNVHVCVCVHCRWLSLVRKDQWLPVCLLPANQMDPLRGTLYLVMSKSGISYTATVTPQHVPQSVMWYSAKSMFTALLVHFVRCVSEDNGMAEGDSESTTTLQGVLQQRNFLK